MKFILAAGGAAGVLASFLAVHAHDESILEERVQEDPALYNPLKARSKWDANWDSSAGQHNNKTPAVIEKDSLGCPK